MAIYVTQLHDYLTLFAVSLTFLRIRYRSISIKMHYINIYTSGPVCPWPDRPYSSLGLLRGKISHFGSVGFSPFVTNISGSGNSKTPR